MSKIDEDYKRLDGADFDHRSERCRGWREAHTTPTVERGATDAGIETMIPIERRSFPTCVEQASIPTPTVEQAPIPTAASVERVCTQMPTVELRPTSVGVVQTTPVVEHITDAAD